MQPNDINTDKTEVGPKVDTGVDKTRRSFTKAGAVGPVLLSFVSKTVWGQTVDQCTISGNLSGNTSPGHQYIDQCDITNPFGLTPGFWGNFTQHPWPENSDFNSHPVFNCTQVMVLKKVGRKKFEVSILSPTLKEAFEPAMNKQLNGMGTYRIVPLDATKNIGDTIDYNNTTPQYSNNLDYLVFHGVAAYLNAISLQYAYPFSVSYIQTQFCAGDVSAIADFEKVIHGTKEEVKNWLITNGMYNTSNGSVTTI